MRLIQKFLVVIDDKRAILIVVGLAALLIAPIAVWGIPEGADLANHYRFAVPFYDSIQKGHLYPGWLSESNWGYGDARFRFYPPGLYYLLAVFKPLLGWFGSTVVSFALLSALGGLGVYFWTRSFLSPRLAALAGVLYALAPYHLNELYQASLLAEYAACAVLPFVFAFIDRVCDRRRVLDIVGLGAAYGLFILTNLPLVVIGSLAALVFGVIRTGRRTFWQVVPRLAAGVAMGLAASSFFWVRMVSELSWIKGSSVDARAYYDYRLNFLFSPDALTNMNTWYANILALMTISFFLPAIILFWKRNGSGRCHAIFGVTIFAGFMSVPLSKPLWIIIPKLAEVQFPWRWLAVVSLGGSVLVAAAVPAWVQLFKTKLRPLYFVPPAAFALSFVFIATQIIWDSKYMTKRELDAFLPKARRGVSYKDWLPINARPILELPKMKGGAQIALRQATVEVWEPEFRKINISDGPAGNLQIRTFYYPNWVASAGGASLNLRPSADGVTLVTVPEGATTIEMKFREPLKVRVAGLVSLLTWLILAGTVILTSARKSLVAMAESRLNSSTQRWPKQFPSTN